MRGFREKAKKLGGGSLPHVLAARDAIKNLAAMKPKDIIREISNRIAWAQESEGSMDAFGLFGMADLRRFDLFLRNLHSFEGRANSSSK